MKFDLRLLQILFLGSFLLFGILILNWDTNFTNVLSVIAVALLTQSLFCLAFNLPINTVKSSLITALGLSILLRSNHPFIFGLAGFFAIGSKYIFRIGGKHFINPANFGVVFIILFTGLAWVSPGQWGNSTILFFVVGSLGLMILTNLSKIDLVLSFAFFYFGMDFCWNILYKGWPLDYFYQNLTNGSILLFSFFMITDPSSTPNSRSARIIWTFLVAALAFYLSAFCFVKGAPLYSLFLLSVMVPLLDKWSKASAFSWDSMKSRELFTNDVPLRTD
jgi:Na+-transporting NADH:ubiquinone oxidoreductase subunit NqrB